MSKTNLATSIETTDELIRRYNESVCNMLADTQLLAYILKYTVTEFEGQSVEEIKNSIGDIEIRSCYVNPGYSNLVKVTGEQTIDLIPGEGEIRYDIRFSVKSGQKMKLLINLEAQNKTRATDLKYHIENRIQYYLSRMISAQKNTEFFGDDYDGIKKVISIWICMDAGINNDGITKFSFKPEKVHGNEVIYDQFDKMEAYIIRIRKTESVEKSKNDLINMLEILLSTKKKSEVKRLLHEEHGMLMEIEDDWEVEKMCNFGEVLYEDALNEGIEKGRLQGKIEMLFEMGFATEEIAKKLGLLPEEIDSVVSLM